MMGVTCQRRGRLHLNSAAAALEPIPTIILHALETIRLSWHGDEMLQRIIEIRRWGAGKSDHSYNLTCACLKPPIDSIMRRQIFVDPCFRHFSSGKLLNEPHSIFHLYGISTAVSSYPPSFNGTSDSSSFLFILIDIFLLIIIVLLFLSLRTALYLLSCHLHSIRTESDWPLLWLYIAVTALDWWWNHKMPVCYMQKGIFLCIFRLWRRWITTGAAALLCAGGPGRFKFCVWQRAARTLSFSRWVITWNLWIIAHWPLLTQL